MTPKILFEDDSFLVLDKPWGMTVNNSETTVGQETIQDWLTDKFPMFPSLAKRSGAGNSQFSDESSDFQKRAGIVHRLDKETSGILLVAKTEQAFLELQRQFKERIVKKSYIALAHGEIKVLEGEINVPVGRLPWNRTQFGVIAGGRESVTKYKVLEVKHLDKEPLTLVQLYPETGRTHQIRVHLKYLGYPIFSDFLYGGRKVAKADRKILPRVFLHAAKIEFNHPASGESVAFESPLPPELKEFLDALE